MFFAYGIIISGITAFVSLFLMSLTTVKKFDLILIEKKLNLPINYAFLMPNSWGRAMAYSTLIWFYNPSSSKKLHKPRYIRYQKQYGNVNFKTYSNSLDRILSLLNLSTCYLGVLFILIIILKGIFS